jgi:hypothetical protein
MSESTQGSLSQLRAKRPRARASCQSCYSRKVRCQRERPICGQCLRLGLVCTYTELQSPLSLQDTSHDAGNLDQAGVLGLLNGGAPRRSFSTNSRMHDNTSWQPDPPSAAPRELDQSSGSRSENPDELSDSVSMHGGQWAAPLTSKWDGISPERGRTHYSWSLTRVG